MCGIIGYVGKGKACKVLLDGLSLLEYRGYDSCGIAFAYDNNITVVKQKGRVEGLKAKCESLERERAYAAISESTCAIGHTRWATHGGVSDINAHPHRVGAVTLVHNGIVENYSELIDEFHLADDLKSDTDSEVVCALIDYYYHSEADPRNAIKKAVEKLKGTYSLVIMFEDKPGKIFAVRNVSPVVISHFEGGTMLASDVSAFCDVTTSYFVLPENAIATLKSDGVSVETFSGEEEKELKYYNIDFEKNASEKNGYPFYMEKEIMEQADRIRDTIGARISGGKVDFSKDGVPDDIFKAFDKLCIVACGTAMHSGLVFEQIARPALKVDIEVWMASEFTYASPILDEKTLVIAISQSGETIDTLEAVKYAKRAKAKVLSILNVKGSLISYESDFCIYTDAGPEIAVASTKAYTTQLAILYLLIAKIAEVRNKKTSEEIERFLENLFKACGDIEKIFKIKNDIHIMAGRLLDAENLFMIGRGLDYAILREGCLKIKEVSYIHSESYASGELKHGPIALITDETPVIASLTQDPLFSKGLSNIREVAARGADVIIIAKESYKNNIPDDYKVIFIPDILDEFAAFSASVVLQFIAYYISSDKGFDVDKPRNLAKVVTVE